MLGDEETVGIGAVHTRVATNLVKKGLVVEIPVLSCFWPYRCFELSPEGRAMMGLEEL